MTEHDVNLLARRVQQLLVAVAKPLGGAGGQIQQYNIQALCNALAERIPLPSHKVKSFLRRLDESHITGPVYATVSLFHNSSHRSAKFVFVYLIC